MKKFLVLLLAAAMVLTLASCATDSGDAKPGSSGDGPIKIGIINNPPSESGYRAANVADFEKVFTSANGYDAKFAFDQKFDQQLIFFRQYITEGVEYILLSAAATDGWEDAFKEAKEAGIKIFLFDRMVNVDSSLYEAAVVSDMRNQGINAVNWLKEQNLAEYNIIHIQGEMGSDAQIGRSEPLNEAVAANGNWNMVLQQTAAWSESDAKAITESAITSGDSFNIIYAENDGMAKGAVAALDEAGISHGVDGDVIIMGFDCNTWALEALLAGEWNFNGQCSPFQAQIIHEMIKGNRAIPADKKYINEEKVFDAKTITQADIDTYGI